MHCNSTTEATISARSVCALIVLLLLDVVTLYVVVISSRKATFSTFLNFMNFTSFQLKFLKKVQVKNKVHKVRTSQYVDRRLTVRQTGL